MNEYDDGDTPVDLQPDVLSDGAAAEELAVAAPPDRAFEETPETPAILDPCRMCQMTGVLRVVDGTPPPRNADKAWELGACFSTSSDRWSWCQTRGLFRGEIDWNRRSRPDPFRREERRRPAPVMKPYVD